MEHAFHGPSVGAVDGDDLSIAELHISQKAFVALEEHSFAECRKLQDRRAGHSCWLNQAIVDWHRVENAGSEGLLTNDEWRDL
jgi:hypothetical protein